MGIKITFPGPLTTIQDLGRFGYQKFGITTSGALDLVAMQTANLLVGNHRDEAVIEMTLMGASMEFTEANTVAITGGNFGPTLNGTPVRMCSAFTVKVGDTLAFGCAQSGCRCYLAFANGLDIPKVMGSKSTNMKCGVGGFMGRKLAMGDEISFAAPLPHMPDEAARVVEYREPSEKEVTIRVVPGPQDDAFTPAGISTFFSSAYTVTNRSDRMGCTLEGPAVECAGKNDIISDGIPLGAIQIPASGKPIVMLSDHQTTGGYTKIGTVATADLPLFVQRKAGDIIHFQQIPVKEAQKLLRKQEKELLKIEDWLLRR